MPVRVVARDTTAQPDHIGRSKVVRQCAFYLGARNSGIACLNVREEALLGCKQLSCSVDINASTLEHKITRPTPKAQRSGYVGRCRAVVLPVAVLRPSVETPAGQGNFTP